MTSALLTKQARNQTPNQSVASSLSDRLEKAVAHHSRHRANMAATLSHRLEIARATHNTQLLELLEREEQELANQSPPPSRSLWQRLMDAIDRSAEISVTQIKGDAGGMIWRACDPRTGEVRYGDSEAEIIDWIEEKI